MILRDVLEIAKQESLGARADASELEDLLLRMAEVHDHLPEIKILWLRKLAAHHLRRETFAEAAQVRLCVKR